MDILSEKTVIQSMLIEASNQLLKAKVADRLFQRANIRGIDNEAAIRMGANQQVIRQTEDMIKDLRDFLKDADDKNPLADVFPKV